MGPPFCPGVPETVVLAVAAAFLPMKKTVWELTHPESRVVREAAIRMSFPRVMCMTVFTEMIGDS
jgi:hypothetical protein